MKAMKTISAITIVLLGLLSVGATLAEEPLPTVAGVSGMTPVTDSSCFAVWIPVPENNALAGIMWYNNDELAVFPEILLESGTPEYPVSLSDGHLVAENVTGESSDWSEVVFAEPVTCASSGLYVLIRLPEGSEQDGLGFGGGAGLGFVENGGCEGWMSIDGNQWVRVGRNFGFAVQPQFVAAQGGMMQMLGAAPQPDLMPTGKDEVLVTELLPVAPNPFNPVTEIRFTLKDSDRVKISVFDLKGRKIADLANEIYEAGSHGVSWEGRDHSGHRVSSGVYFARLQVGHESFTRRMLLVK
jgi:hypothetical protein